ncbi:MAG: hypothetical protein QXG01_03400 [Candidatus Bathyarchaeia archaeon]
MKTEDEKRQKPWYGYYGLPKFSILVTVVIFICVIVAILFWQLLGMIIICFGFYAFLSFIMLCFDTYCSKQTYSKGKA